MLCLKLNRAWPLSSAWMAIMGMPRWHWKQACRYWQAASETGIAVMRIINSFHFAAMWPETEYLAEQGLAGLACAFKPSVAPAGASRLGTNPISFAWPRPAYTPVVLILPPAWQKGMFKSRHAMAMLLHPIPGWGRWPIPMIRLKFERGAIALWRL